jgi:hypothetical protein
MLIVAEIEMSEASGNPKLELSRLHQDLKDASRSIRNTRLTLGATYLFIVPGSLYLAGAIPTPFPGFEKFHWVLVAVFTLCCACGVYELVSVLLGVGMIFVIFIPTALVASVITFKLLLWGTAEVPFWLAFMGKAGWVSLLIASIALLAEAFWFWRNTPTA